MFVVTETRTKERDYYDVLEGERGADGEKIKRAYRDPARRYRLVIALLLVLPLS
jgi:hypothetical protein